MSVDARDRRRARESPLPADEGFAVTSDALIFARLKDFRVDPERLRDHFVRHVSTRPPTPYRDHWVDYVGWAVTSRDGSLDDGVRHIAAREAVAIAARGARPTEICAGYLAEVMHRLLALGIAPFRARLMLLESEGAQMPFHRDATRQAWRLHIPVFTNPDCRFEWRREDGSTACVHLAADGSAWLVRVDVAHRALNRSLRPSSRVHLLMGLRAPPKARLLAPPWLPLASTDRRV